MLIATGALGRRGQCAEAWRLFQICQIAEILRGEQSPHFPYEWISEVAKH